MRIVDERTKGNVQFKGLYIGRVFQYKGDVYMKTEFIMNNAVKLIKGTLHSFDSFEMVRCIEVELIIKGEN